MIKLEFFESYDYGDCDTCGGNYDNGLVVKVDGEVVVDSPAVASCFGGSDIQISYNGYKAFATILEHITGKKVEFSVEGEDYRY